MSVFWCRSTVYSVAEAIYVCNLVSRFTNVHRSRSSFAIFTSVILIECSR